MIYSYFGISFEGFVLTLPNRYKIDTDTVLNVLILELK